MSHHTADPVCPLCADKLQMAVPELVAWFNRIKAVYPNAHVSWSYRNQADQEQFFKDGKTQCHYPNSAHNKMQNGKPAALALDIFLIDEDGSARFPGLWYAKLNAENEQNREPILWGGRWKHLGDMDHFEFSGAQRSEA